MGDGWCASRGGEGSGGQTREPASRETRRRETRREHGEGTRGGGGFPRRYAPTGDWRLASGDGAKRRGGQLGDFGPANRIAILRLTTRLKVSMAPNQLPLSTNSLWPPPTQRAPRCVAFNHSRLRHAHHTSRSHFGLGINWLVVPFALQPPYWRKTLATAKKMKQTTFDREEEGDF